MKEMSPAYKGMTKTNKAPMVRENFKNMEHTKSPKIKMNKPAPMLGVYKKKM